MGTDEYIWIGKCLEPAPENCTDAAPRFRQYSCVHLNLLPSTKFSDVMLPVLLGTCTGTLKWPRYTYLLGTGAGTSTGIVGSRPPR